MQSLKRALGLPLRFARARQRKARFDSVCRQAGLKLDYELNRAGLAILEEVFVHRLYADYFPFYRPNQVVDVGGHFGYFALFAALNSAAGTRIVAVEPSVHNVAVLRANLASCGVANVEVVHGAAADQRGTLELHVSKAHNCSLFAEHVVSMSGGELGSEMVEAFTLADVFQQHNLETVDVLKLDCEGAEYPIIYNAPEELLRRVGVLMMEFHDTKDPQRTGLAMVRQLEAKGFRIAQFRHLPTTMNLNYGKIIAVRR